MSKTIKEIAEEIGVSKQAVFKKIKRQPLSTSLQGLMSTVDGRLTVSVGGEKLIKQAFFKNDRQPVDGRLTVLVDDSSTKVDGRLTVSVDGSSTPQEDSEVTFLRSQVERLQAELEKEREHNREKDKQLLDTLNKLAESQAALSVGQAADKQKALAEKIIEGNNQIKREDEIIKSDESEKKISKFFGKIFGKY